MRLKELPDFSNFRVFGSTVGKFIDKSNRSKLESTAILGVYFGNSSPKGAKTHFSEFLVFIPESQTIPKLGQIKVLENIDALGYIAAHPLSLDWDIAGAGSESDNQISVDPVKSSGSFLQQNNLPANLFIGKQKVFNAATKIVRHYVWFDSEDTNESYAVIEVFSGNRKNSSLVTVRTFLEFASDKQKNFSLLRDYIRTTSSKFPSIFPLLAITACEYDGKSWENSIIISSDPNDERVFGVAIPDFSLDRPIVDLRDVARGAVALKEDFVFLLSDKVISANHSVPRSLAGIDRLPDAAEWWSAYHTERDQMFHQYKAIEPLKIKKRKKHCWRPQNRWAKRNGEWKWNHRTNGWRNSHHQTGAQQTKSRSQPQKQHR